MRDLVEAETNNDYGGNDEERNGQTGTQRKVKGSSLLMHAFLAKDEAELGLIDSQMKSAA